MSREGVVAAAPGHEPRMPGPEEIDGEATRPTSSAGREHPGRRARASARITESCEWWAIMSPVRTMTGGGR